MKQEASLKHQVRWDLKYVRWALVAVAVIAPLQVWLELREFGRFERGLDLGLPLSSWIWILLLMVSVVALVLVVQKDVPAGPREFWLSRPVSRGVMLGSKLIVFGLFLVFLGAVSLVAPLLSNEMEYGGEFVASYLVKSAWILMLAVVLAAVSSSLKAVVSNGLLLGALVILVLFVKGSFYDERAISFRPYEISSSAGLIAWVAFLVGGAGLVVWKYLEKSMRGGFVGLIGLFVLTGAIYQFWNTGLFLKEMSQAEKKEEGWENVGLQLRLNEKDLNMYRGALGSGSVNGVRVDRVPCSGVIKPLPEGFSVQDIYLSGSFEVDGKKLWEAPHAWSRIPTYLGKEEFRGMTDLAKHEDVTKFGSTVQGRGLSLTHLNLGEMPVSELEAWMDKKVFYRGMARVEAVKTVRLARFRYGQDSVANGEGMRMRVNFEEDGESVGNFKLEGKSWFPRPFFSSLDYQGFRYFLVNEERKEYFEVSSSRGGASRLGRSYIWRKEFEVGRWLSRRIIEDLADADQWLAESYLEVYAPIPQGKFTVPVELEDISIEDIFRSRR